LGRLTVSIVTEGEQVAVFFSVENGAVRDLIERSLPQLREQLSQSGLQLADSGVRDESSSRNRADADGITASRLLPGNPTETDTNTLSQSMAAALLDLYA